MRYRSYPWSYASCSTLTPMLPIPGKEQLSDCTGKDYIISRSFYAEWTVGRGLSETQASGYREFEVQ